MEYAIMPNCSVRNQYLMTTLRMLKPEIAASGNRS
jgi:hypothetical protein